MRTIEEILKTLNIKDIKENIKDKKTNEVNKINEANKAKMKKIKKEFQKTLEEEGYEVLNIDWDFNTKEVYVSIIPSPEIPYNFNNEVVIVLYESW